MSVTLASAAFSELDSTTFGVYMVTLVLLTIVELAIMCGILQGFYLLLTLPMRRNERARLFLELLELGLKEGRTAEQAIADAALSHDRDLGKRFHRLASHLYQGRKLSDALTQVPALLPPQIVGMLRAGERVGDVAKVLPACGKMLRDGVSQVRGALNYLLILTFVITPGTVFVPAMIAVLVLPKFKEVFYGMGMGRPLPAFTAFVFQHGRQIVWIQMAVIGLIWLLLIAYVGGPRLYGWLKRIAPSVPDRILFRFPWRRKRVQRDFSAMLAVLLDAGVPEADAVAIAAEATANELVIARSQKVLSQMKSGVKLPEALRALDDSGELHWRLTNALKRGSGFLQALTGWHDALDAKAFQSEQTAAQITTSALVLFNGLVVAGVVIGIFLALTDLMIQATLW